MININVCCSTTLYFLGGTVSGRIVVSPDSILEAIFTNVSLDYRSQYRTSTRKLIAQEVSHRMILGLDEDLHLLDGEVCKNFVKMTLHEAMDLLLNYLRLDDFEEGKIHANKYDREAWSDLLRLRDYIYRCDECTVASQTANVDI